MNFNFNLELTGLNFQERNIEIKSKVVLFKSMNKMKEISQRRVPVDTGLLKSSIKLTPRFPGSEEYELSDGQNYGAYVEFGTRRQSAQPFFRPAFMEVKEYWIEQFTKNS